MRKLTVEELGRMNSDQFRLSSKLPVTIVLDNVRSLYNIGSVFRTCDAFRIEQIFLCGITATPDKSLAEIHKTALGAENTVKWNHFKDTSDAVKMLIAEGYNVIAVEQVDKSRKLGEYDIEEGHYALIFGNEVKGVRQDVVDMCDSALEIPQYGTKHSLNVSVSVGIVLWEFALRLNKYLR